MASTHSFLRDISHKKGNNYGKYIKQTKTK